MFRKSTLPKGYDIVSVLSKRSNDTVYGLYKSDKLVATQITGYYGHKACLRKLRRAARQHAKNGVTAL